MKKIIFRILVWTIWPAVMVQAGDGKGGQPAVFRDLAQGARPAALGGAFTAVAEGGAGIMYNPAGATQSERKIVSAGYRAMTLDRRMGQVVFSFPARENSGIAFNWDYAGTAPLAERDSRGYVLPDKEISYSENLFGVTFAKQFGEYFLLGGRVFYIQNSLAMISAYTVGVDFGVLAKIDLRSSFLRSSFPLLRVGLAGDNFGARYRWTTTEYWRSHGLEQGATTEEDFPEVYRLGAVLEQPGRYLLTTDLEVQSTGKGETHVGGEYTYRRLLVLRAGLDSGHPTFGLGVFRQLGDSRMIVCDFAYLLGKAGAGDDLLLSLEFQF